MTPKQMSIKLNGNNKTNILMVFNNEIQYHEKNVKF